MHDIVLATNNAGKVTEFQELLANLSWRIMPQSAFGLPSVEETGFTFVENALIKARYAAEHTGLPALADDSGLVVDALHGAPGVYSARYAGENATATQHIEKLLNELTHITEKKRTARFHCALVYIAYPADPTPIITQGSWEGHILHAPQGTQGFGYDPVFFDTTHHCSAAELSQNIKNKISHRGRALNKLLQELSDRNLLNIPTR
jgi:XTP/dITP diphosphohydrolase